MVQHLQYSTAALCSRSLQGDVSDIMIAVWLLHLQSMHVSNEGEAETNTETKELITPAPLPQLASFHNA